MTYQYQGQSKIENHQDVARIFRGILVTEGVVDQDKEHFWVVGLQANNQIKYIELVSLGTANTTIVHPRETFRLAIMQGVISIICAHNHPSGSLEVSQQDKKMANRLNQAGEILGIEVLDHIIITKNNSISYGRGEVKNGM